ncbi:hypothetical protein [Flagellimonas sp. SN16]|uniref:hypothetical protein n=1 Tax=Flagellimonas sp. SN16 TaxID=3415142 RepID=UPI003C662AA7
MAGERLTDKDAIDASTISLLDVLHLVDVSDTTSNAAGTSFKTTIFNLLLKRTFIYSTNAMVFKSPANAGTLSTEPQLNDWVIFMSDTRLVIGKAKDDIASMPTDLDDGAKFIKFIDATP